MLAFGRQLDARPVRTSRRTDDPDRALTPGQVAGYLAKYATKSADDTGATDNPHHRRLRATARRLAARAKPPPQTRPATSPYALLGKWVHMLGFRGHFASKSRRYSITLGALRRARRRAQALIAESRATGRPLDLAALEADLLADDDARHHPGHRPLDLRRHRLAHRRPNASSPPPPPPAPASTTSGRRQQRRTRVRTSGERTR